MSDDCPHECTGSFRVEHCRDCGQVLSPDYVIDMEHDVKVLKDEVARLRAVVEAATAFVDARLAGHSVQEGEAWTALVDAVGTALALDISGHMGGRGTDERPDEDMQAGVLPGGEVGPAAVLAHQPTGDQGRTGSGPGPRTGETSTRREVGPGVAGAAPEDDAPDLDPYNRCTDCGTPWTECADHRRADGGSCCPTCTHDDLEQWRRERAGATPEDDPYDLKAAADGWEALEAVAQEDGWDNEDGAAPADDPSLCPQCGTPRVLTRKWNSGNPADIWMDECECGVTDSP